MPEWTPFRWVRLGAWIALVVLSAAPARSQPISAQPVGEVEVAADAFGTGSTARPGEWIGLKLELTDSSDRPREVLVRVTLRDRDGDRPVWERSVATNPGLKQPVWVYCRLPFWFTPSSVLAVAVHAAGEPGDNARDSALPQATVGRLLGAANIPATPRLLEPLVGMIGVVGRRPLGLTRYEGFGNAPYLTFGHERMELVPIDAPGLPDRWMGLAMFDAIAWGEGQPGQLAPDVAHAIREWVRRGGHLIVVLPRVGQTWTDETVNPLFDLIPKVRIERRESVDLAPFEPMLRRVRVGARRLPDKETVHFFAPAAEREGEGSPESGWGEAVPILNAPDGRCIAVRRSEGTGAVTLIGLDLGSRFFQQDDLPQADLFWHRILGRRGALPREDELTSGTGRPRAVAVPTGRTQSTLDRDFGGQINKTERAAAGVLIGFVVFIAYWLVAGPVGFFVLKQTGRSHHAWVAFTLAAGVFTAIAWGGATAIRPRRVEASHLTFLDHVYGQPWQRARSWVNLLTPVYGEARVSVGDPASRGGGASVATSDRFHNTIAPWDTPGSDSGGGFPDARAYRIESKSPEAIGFPARSTVKQFQVDWAGGPRWSMPRPEPGPDGERRIEILPEPREGQPVLRGVLTHDLPGPLSEVTIVVVRGQKGLDPSLVSTFSERMLADVVVARVSGDWAPGRPLDLTVVKQHRTVSDSEGFFTSLLPQARDEDQGIGGGRGEEQFDPRGLAGRLNALAFYSQLAPPREDTSVRAGPQAAAFRTMTHGWDLGRWFTQPCVIVVGHLGEDGDQPSPVPLYADVGGGYREAPTRGRTVVRWVYPLSAGEIEGGGPPAYPVRLLPNLLEGGPGADPDSPDSPPTPTGDGGGGGDDGNGG